MGNDTLGSLISSGVTAMLKNASLRVNSGPELGATNCLKTDQGYDQHKHEACSIILQRKLRNCVVGLLCGP